MRKEVFIQVIIAHDLRMRIFTIETPINTQCAANFCRRFLFLFLFLFSTIILFAALYVLLCEGCKKTQTMLDFFFLFAQSFVSSHFLLNLLINACIYFMFLIWTHFSLCDRAQKRYKIKTYLLHILCFLDYRGMKIKTLVYITHIDN